MTKNRTPTLVYLDPGMHPGLEVKGLINQVKIVLRLWQNERTDLAIFSLMTSNIYVLYFSLISDYKH